MQAIELTLRFCLEDEAETEQLFCLWDLLMQEILHGRGGGISGGFLPAALIARGFAFMPDVKLLEGPPELRLIDVPQRQRRDADARTARSEARTDRSRREAA